MAEEKRDKADIHDEEGVKDSRNREDQHRQDKRPKPGPLTGPLDQGLADGAIAPDPEVPAHTRRD